MATQKLMQGFTDGDNKALPKTKKTLFLMTTETSERDTKAKLRGIGTLPTTEFVYLVGEFSVLGHIPHKGRLHCGGTNCSDTLGPFDRPKKIATWQVRQSEKAKLYGSALVLAGGKVE